MLEVKNGKKYYDELNVFRSFIIIWVVIGHSFDSGNDFLGLLHGYAYTFHMKAFILLSGFFFYNKIKKLGGVKSCAALIGNRFLRLMVPYYFYTAISLVLKFLFERYANNKLGPHVILYSLIGLENPNGGLWFLFALFVLNIVAIILYKLPSWATFILSAAAYIFYMCFGVLRETPILNWIFYYGIFFFLGMLLYSNYDKLSVKINDFSKNHLLPYGIVSLALIPLAFIITTLITKNIESNDFSDLLIAFFNIIIYYVLSIFVNSLVKVKAPFMTIGNYGMDIYLIGYYVQIGLRVVLKSMLGLPYIVYSLSMFIFGLLLPIPISKYFVRKFRITRILALGDYKKSKPKDDEK